MTTDPTLPDIIRVELKELIHDPNNANKMPPEKYATLVRNIKATGKMLQPILVQATPNGKWKIVDGHNRSNASAEAGLTHVLGVVWDGTEEMRQIFAIGFNHLRGELDLSIVQQTFTSLWNADIGMKAMTMTGYSEQEITDLLKVTADIDADEVMQNPIAVHEEDESKPDRPLVIELTFANRADFEKAKRGLRRAAGKGRELGDGLLSLLLQEDKE